MVYTIRTGMRLASQEIIVLDPGEELHQVLSDYAKTNGLQSGWIQAIGTAKNVVLGFYDKDTKQFKWQEFNQTLEIVSLSGNLSVVDGEPYWHIHGVFSGSDYTPIAGHVKELVVGLTCEVYFRSIKSPLTRRFDDHTGLNLLHPQTD